MRHARWFGAWLGFVFGGLLLASCIDLSTGEGGAGGGGGEGAGPISPCGTGVLEGEEECDDGNDVAGDGCTGCLACAGPKDFWDPKGHHCYTFGIEDLAWDKARFECQKLGAAFNADLAGISTAEERAFLAAQLKGETFVGGTDRDLECVFTWKNGEPWAPAWASSQPDDAGNDEDCVALRPEGTLNDRSCTEPHDYLCERVPLGRCGDGIVQPAEECDDGNGIAEDGCHQCRVVCKASEVKEPESLHCYEVVTAPKSWLVAEVECEDRGGKLATVTSPTERAFLKPLLLASSWIGASRPSGGAFSWANDEPLCWTSWDMSEPNGLTEDCVQMRTNGLWNNQTCSEEHAFVCERTPFGG
jgi:cysteine-rich repeat protein